MTPQLEQVIDTVRTLSSSDKLELLQFISQDLQYSNDFARKSKDFWEPQSIDEIVRAQNAPVVTGIDLLVADFWPEDEPVDEFEQFISEQRHIEREGSL